MTEAATVRPHGKIADIELLRAIAVIFVLIQHAPINLLAWTNGQNMRLYYYFGYWDGVDLFFAISGFVIARSLLPRLAAAKDPTGFFNEALAFWVRRVWRLVPSAWLWLAIILLCSIFLNTANAFGSFRANLEGAVAAVLDIANFRLVSIFSRFDSGASFPYWSLSLEEQFYIFLPFLVFVSRRWLPYVATVAIAAQLFITRSGEGANATGLLLTQLRSDALLLGVLIAIWSNHPTYRLYEPVGLKARPLAGLVVLALLTLCLAIIGSPFLHFVWFQVGEVAVISAALVWVASYDRDYLFPAGAPKRLMLWFGSRSYAMYLIHVPAYFLTREIWFRIEPPGTEFDASYTARFLLTAGALIVVSAELNYRFVEMPLRRRGARIAERLSRRTA
jgi:peptidoglycan/LPS O-acetylase OafA/YrhL